MLDRKDAQTQTSGHTQIEPIGLYFQRRQRQNNARFAACSSGFPRMEEREPISVIYQTAEDGLGDIVK